MLYSQVAIAEVQYSDYTIIMNDDTTTGNKSQSYYRIIMHIVEMGLRIFADLNLKMLKELTHNSD